MTAASNSEARKRAAEAASNSESPLSQPIPAPVDSGAIGRLNEADLALGDFNRFCVLSFSRAAVERILREHTDRALAEVEQRIRDTFADPERRRPQIGKFGTDLANDVEWCLLIVRAARKEQGR